MSGPEPVELAGQTSIDDHLVDGRAEQLHRPRCCDNPRVEATWGMGHGTPGYHDKAFITVWCTECGTDLVTLDPPSGGDRGMYIGPWDHTR